MTSLCREPICGAKTEVYSRITGYYRPVQNWNDGKAQEYKERKVYDMAASTAPKGGLQHQRLRWMPVRQGL